MESRKSEAFRFLPKSLLRWGANLGERISQVLVALKLSPNVLTGMGLLAGMAAGLLFFLERPLWAWLALFVCSALDVLDGKVAVLTNRTSAFGASSIQRWTAIRNFLFTWA